jgi:hypothetical protein
MVAARASSQQDTLAERLRSPEASTRLKAIREVKNQIIGNKAKKQAFLEVIPYLLEHLAAKNADSEVVVQCAACVGSFSYGIEDGIKAIVAHDGVSVLVRALLSSEERVVEAAARSLKLVCQVCKRCSAQRTACRGMPGAAPFLPGRNLHPLPHTSRPTG